MTSKSYGGTSGRSPLLTLVSRCHELVRSATKYETAKSTARHTAAKRAVEEAYEALEAFEAKV